MKERLVYFDILRGLAIFMVVAIHTFPSLHSATEGELFIRQLLNLAVPLFLAISGFFLANKQVDLKERYVAFLKKQIPRVYIPVILWSMPLFALAIYQAGSIVVNLFLLLVCGYSIYYFVAVVIQYYLLLPVLQRMTKKYRGGVIISCISIFSVLLVTYILQFKGIRLPLILYAGWSPLWMIFFFIGVYLGKRGSRYYSAKRFALGSLLFWGISYVETFYLMSHYGGGVGIKLSSFIYSFLGILFLFSHSVEQFLSKIKGLTKLGTTFGKYSFGIYLSHCYVIILFDRLIPNWADFPWLFKWVFVIVLSYIIIKLLDCMLPKLSIYLGLK